jgi:hypothetical protein
MKKQIIVSHLPKTFTELVAQINAHGKNAKEVVLLLQNYFSHLLDIGRGDFHPKYVETTVSPELALSIYNALIGGIPKSSLSSYATQTRIAVAESQLTKKGTFDYTVLVGNFAEKPIPPALPKMPSTPKYFSGDDIAQFKPAKNEFSLKAVDLSGIQFYATELAKMPAAAPVVA